MTTERELRYRDAQAKRDRVRVTVWAHKDDAAAIKKLAGELREARKSGSLR